MKRFDYTGKIAIITGASSGIGKELARELISKYGCTVYALSRGKERLELARQELGKSYIPYPMDASSKENWRDFAELLKNNDTSPDILINCAGILPKFEPFLASGSEALKNVVEINLMAGVYGCESIIPLMKDGSAVINISSASALCPFALTSAYSASKAGFENFSEALSCELDNISVTTVMPGFVKTDIMKSQGASDKDKKFIDKFSADAYRVARKILKATRKRKRHLVIGYDAKMMSSFYKSFPNSAPKTISRFLKKSGLALFNK